MSKKKRKTRSQKEVAKKHNLEHLVKKAPKPVAVRKTKKDQEVAEAPDESTAVPVYIIQDFKKVSLIIGMILLAILTLWLIIYQTDILNGFLSRFRISY